MHWHGLNQPGTPYFDGVLTVDQCPIVPGGNLTYRFRADEIGTSWYHSHYSAQYASGVVGPIVIHGPNQVEYDYDLGPIMVSDWFHDTYDHITDLVLTPTDTGLPYRPLSDSNLVNGAGQYPCANVTDGAPCSETTPDEYAAWQFEAGKTYRLRFINAGASAFETISIDGHTMTVIANDFVAVQPYETQYVTLGVGQRTDVLVTADAADPTQAYWLRTYNQPQCGDTNGPDGRGIIYYSGSGSDGVVPTPTNTDSSPPPVNTFCQNDPLASTVPVYVIPAAEPDVTITLTIAGSPNATGVFHWTMNNVTYEGDLDTPLLFDVIQQQTQNFEVQSNVYNTGTNGTVRLVVYNTLPAPHPMHLHGHDFQVLAEGFGTWDGVTVTNAWNPQRRDVHSVWAGANATDPSVGTNYIVVQFQQDNPGVWPFHCHIAWHLSAGLSIMILERPEELLALEIPQSVTDTCTAFEQWQTSNLTPDTDDGLRRRSTEQHLDQHRRQQQQQHKRKSAQAWGEMGYFVEREPAPLAYKPMAPVDRKLAANA